MQGPSRVEIALLALILLSGLALRCAIVLASDRPPTPYAVNDETSYYLLARNLVQGRGFSASGEEPWRPTAVRTPGYPLFLSLSFLLGPDTLKTGLWAGLLADLSSGFLLWLLVRRLRPALGLLAALAWCWMSPFLPLLEFLYADPVGAAWVALATVFLTGRRGARWRGAAGGLAWGAAVLTRPFLLVCAAAQALVCGRRRLLLLAAGFASVLLPWIVRNALVFGAFIPLSYAGVGMNAWVGTWKDAGPVMVLEPGPQGPRAVFEGPWARSEEEARRAASAWNRYMEIFLGEGGPEIRTVDRELLALALSRIRDEPMAWLGLRVRNAGQSWGLPQVPGPPIVGWLLVLLAVIGAVRLFRAGHRNLALRLGLPVLALALFLFPLRSLPRYAANVAPLLFALAACGLPLPIERASRLSPDVSGDGDQEDDVLP